MRNDLSPLGARQCGAVLVVSLVLLLLITLVALATISGSTFQTTKVNNMQKRESIFRVGESAAEQALTSDNVAQAYNSSTSNFTVPADALTTPERDAVMAAIVTYRGDGPLPVGYSIENNKKWTNRTYESAGSSRSSDGRAATRVIQGASKTEPNLAGSIYDPS